MSKMDVHWIFLISSIFTLVNSFFLHNDPADSFGCEVGWVNANGNCYLFINTRTVTWQEAGDECATHDSSLLHFDNLEEKSWYTSYVESNSTVASAGYWTGLNDLPVVVSGEGGTGVWRWNQHDIVNVSLITWNVSPENDGLSSCGGMNVKGKMSDVSCDSKQGYICAYNLAGFTEGCLLAWFPTETDCYWVSDTIDPSQLLTWGEAKAKCSQFYDRASLITMDTERSQSFMEVELPYLTQNAQLYWTGLQYSNEQWQWFNGSTVGISSLQWAREPDNVAGMEHCAVIRRNGRFSDRDCNSQQNFICKKKQTSRRHQNLGCGSWTRAGKSCFKFYDEPLSTWQEAQTHCQSVQGDLINVKSVDTQLWLNAQLELPFHARKYWTGLTDKAVEGSFVWTDGIPMDSKIVAWNQEPKNLLDQPYCGVLKTNGHFEDLPCRSYKAAAICELDNTRHCPTNGGIWMSRVADSRTSYNCYLFTPFNNRSLLFLSSEAESYCRSLAISSSLVPSLLSIDSLTEKAFITNAVKTYTDNPYGFHTFLNNKENGGFWTFGKPKENTTQHGLIDWGGEPNDQTVDTDCVSINYGGRYGVNKCSFKYGFICQRPAVL